MSPFVASELQDNKCRVRTGVEAMAYYRAGDSLASLVPSGHARILVYWRSTDILFHTRFLLTASGFPSISTFPT